MAGATTIVTTSTVINRLINIPPLTETPVLDIP